MDEMRRFPLAGITRPNGCTTKAMICKLFYYAPAWKLCSENALFNTMAALPSSIDILKQ